MIVNHLHRAYSGWKNSSKEAKSLFLYLATFAREEDGWCYVSRSTIIEDGIASKNHLKKFADELIENGLIKGFKKGSFGGSKKLANEYTLLTKSDLSPISPERDLPISPERDTNRSYQKIAVIHKKPTLDIFKDMYRASLEDKGINILSALNAAGKLKLSQETVRSYTRCHSREHIDILLQDLTTAVVNDNSTNDSSDDFWGADNDN